MCVLRRGWVRRNFIHTAAKVLLRCEKTKLMRETRNKTKSKKISQASRSWRAFEKSFFFLAHSFPAFLYLFTEELSSFFIPKTPTRRKKARFHSFIWSYANGIYANIEKLLVCIRFHPVVFRGECSYPSKVIRDSLFDILSHPLIRRCRLLHCCSLLNPSQPPSSTDYHSCCKAVEKRAATKQINKLHSIPICKLNKLF